MKGVRIRKKIKEEVLKRPQCPECGSHFVVKDGKQWGKQTFLCTICRRRFTPSASHIFRPRYTKEQAIRMFVNGMSINAIAKTFNIPFSTVYKWIKKAGIKAQKKFLLKLRALKKAGKVKAISIDEMWSFAGKKENDIWIWSVVVEYSDGKIEKYLFTGKRDEETFLKDIGAITRSRGI